MGATIFLNIISLIYILVLFFVYFSKKRLNKIENKIYSFLIIAIIVQLSAGLLIYFTMINYQNNEYLNVIIDKFYLVTLLNWMILFTCYAVVISSKESATKKIFSLFTGIYIISVICIAMLPLKLEYIDNNTMFSEGPSINALYMVSIICIIIMLTTMITNIKKIIDKRYIPLFAFIILGTMVLIIQKINPQLFLITPLESFLTFLMYFTIENPDMRLIEQLNIAREQAEKANNAKSDFLSNMSHEIRTPLNAIVGFSQALLEEDLPGEAKEEVKDIVMASENLLEIVNGILDISKIEANKLEIINTEYQLSKITKELITLTKTRIGEKPIEFRTNFDPSIPEVLYGDHTRLKQVILNILTNAAKYTKEGFVEFKISSVIKDDICRLIISVEDSGIGIKPEKINSLFSKFDRLGVEEDITIEGTGLGLAITKKLVDLMGGKIVVQSVYGKGSKFTVAIDQKIIATKAPIKQEETEVVKSIDFSGKRILVVDDNKVNLKVAERLLRSYNVEVETVSSGIECLEKINNKEFYDIILMDDMMPKMSGTETFHKLKEIPDFNIPVVALTANAISGMKEKYLSEGFNDYLAKPIQKIELNQVLTKYLK